MLETTERSEPELLNIAPPPLYWSQDTEEEQLVNVQCETEFSPPAVKASAPPLLSEDRKLKVQEMNEEDADNGDGMGFAESYAVSLIRNVSELL